MGYRTSDLLISGLYLLLSYPLFLKVFQTSREVIDEEFHLRQAKQYCAGNFHVWDPKITTLPGLYLLTTLLIPAKFCSTFNLRLFSLIASALNIFLFKKILYIINARTSIKNSRFIWDAINLAIFPPMYFFAHLYYTDIVSITSVLGLYYYWLRDNQILSALFGFLSIMIRQTNIVWIVMFMVISCFKNVIQNFKTKSKIKNRNNVNVFQKRKDILLAAIYWHLLNLNELINLVYSTIKQLWLYIALILGFLLFVILNGSIVVGDKSAHVAKIHSAQVFYFSLFVLIFGFPILISNLRSSFLFILKHKFIFAFIFCFFIIIVHFNTLEHPYLLADNRHYTFYIWNRFYSKYYLFRYIIVPVYIVSLVLIFNSIEVRGLNFVLAFSTTTFLVLSLQYLLEVRYFIIPYIILRLNIIEKKYVFLLIETIYYLIINYLTFSVFFTKEIHWDNFENIQRLIW